MKSKKERVAVYFQIETSICPSDVPSCLLVKAVEGEDPIFFALGTIKNNQKSNKIIAVIHPDENSLETFTASVYLSEDQIPVANDLIQKAFNAQKNKLENTGEIEFTLSIEDHRREPKPSNEQHIRAALSTAILLLSAAVTIALVATGAGWLAFCALIVVSTLLWAATHAVTSSVETQDVKRTMK